MRDSDFDSKRKKGTYIGYGNKHDFTKDYEQAPGVGRYEIQSVWDKYKWFWCLIYRAIYDSFIYDLNPEDNSISYNYLLQLPWRTTVKASTTSSPTIWTTFLRKKRRKDFLERSLTEKTERIVIHHLSFLSQIMKQNQYQILATFQEEFQLQVKLKSLSLKKNQHLLSVSALKNCANLKKINVEFALNRLRRDVNLNANTNSVLNVWTAGLKLPINVPIVEKKFILSGIKGRKSKLNQRDLILQMKMTTLIKKNRSLTTYVITVRILKLETLCWFVISASFMPAISNVTKLSVEECLEDNGSATSVDEW